MLGLRFLDCFSDVFGVVSVRHGASMPAVSFEPLTDILGEIDLGGARQRDVILVVKINEFAQLEVSRQRRGFLRDALHQIAVTANRVGVVVHDFVAGPIITGR